MHTLLELIRNMTHSSMQGLLGVTGIVLFLILLVGTGIYRMRQLEERDSKH